MSVNRSNDINKHVKKFLKLHCDERFTHAFTACDCVFKEITLVDSNQGNFLENATACSKRIRKTLVATLLKTNISEGRKVSIFLREQRKFGSYFVKLA